MTSKQNGYYTDDIKIVAHEDGWRYVIRVVHDGMIQLQYEDWDRDSMDWVKCGESLSITLDSAVMVADALRFFANR